ncbi:hypothetical protein ACHWQZ_G002943 [Mnemiopsis leidyi]
MKTAIIQLLLLKKHLHEETPSLLVELVLVTKSTTQHLYGEVAQQTSGLLRRLYGFQYHRVSSTSMKLWWIYQDLPQIYDSDLVWRSRGNLVTFLISETIRETGCNHSWI